MVGQGCEKLFFSLLLKESPGTVTEKVKKPYPGKMVDRRQESDGKECDLAGLRFPRLAQPGRIHRHETAFVVNLVTGYQADDFLKFRDRTAFNR